MLLQDEVWAQLAPRRLPRGRVFVVVGIVAVLTLAVVVAGRLGLIQPRLSLTTSGGTVGIGSKRLTSNLQLTNRGRSQLVVGQIALSAPWLEVASITYSTHDSRPPTPALPFSLEPDETAHLELTVRVIDCTAIAMTGSEVLVTVSGPMLFRQATLQPPDGPSHSWPVEEAADACAGPLPSTVS